MSENLNVLVNIMQEFDAKVKANGKELINETLKDFFVKHPEVEYLCWTQYAPYFNDGEACEFSVHEPMVKLKKTNPDAEDEEDLDYWDLDGPWKFRESNPSLAEDLRSLAQAFNTCESALRSIFGDDCKVTVYGFPEFKVEVSEFRHD